MVNLAGELHGIIKAFRKATNSKKLNKAWDKLTYFSDDLENAHEWHEDHEGSKCKSCSSLRKIRKLQKIVEKLQQKYEGESESNKESDEGFVYYADGMDIGRMYTYIPSRGKIDVNVCVCTPPNKVT